MAEFQQANDPLEPTNRVLYKVNTALDDFVLRPAAIGLSRRSAGSGPQRHPQQLNNLATPVKLGNDMAQGKPRLAGNTFMRFVINTTVGGLGFFDPASHWGYPDHDTDFGITLAVWGLPEGPFLFLPLLGPATRAMRPADWSTSRPTRWAALARALSSPG